ncbi:condensin-1 complex subunit CAP-D2-like isoform X1 [Amaranthus tricolor]|uniref:condensin-1 complex subunit CAP-D2-like isoform X1 n=1 Tax=Amaranthus tricolor TaxID=29722 RepID=UPI00258BA45C|nr:condensin-1 complex subunit CAP-D2-like isoform X1 [Amaranthus tricolor]XP_057535384.1 condensin-1 complex subunit CAP-D2-like isoform X1 [Amaranthus tricolor]
MQKNPELQAAAMLALCRFMVVDATFCEANLRLLFTVVENASSQTVRSNCTIALGDLAVRFPNLVEPWTEHMYARLRDSSVSVRINAILVLSHLILNEMMKVKGYIYEMALRLEDEDERISNLAKLFTELAKKGSNPIYNLLPDIVGKLSQQNLDRESFCNIMQFLIGSIKKDKQMEGLVEKLCNRFNGVTDSSQWECLAYCLSQLSFTDKGMKKLIDSFETYEHALCEDSVTDNSRNIIIKAKKFAKPELKSAIEEFEEKLNKFHSEKKEQEVTARNAQDHKNRIDGLGDFTVADKIKHENGDATISEDGEVIDASDGPCLNDITNSTVDHAEDCSTITSDSTQTEANDDEVLSPIVNQKDVPSSRSRKSRARNQKVVNTTSVRTRSTRSKQRSPSIFDFYLVFGFRSFLLLYTGYAKLKFLL